MLTGIGFNSFSTTFGKAYKQNNRTLGQAVERLATGLKVNRAADDVANTANIQALTSSIRGYEVAERNLGDAVSLTRTAGAGLSSIRSELQEMRDLAVQAGNETLSDVEKQALHADLELRLTNISDIAGSSSFNGINLLDSSAGSITIQTGTDSTNTDTVDLSGNFDHASSTAAGNLNEGNLGGASGVALNNIDLVNGDIDDILTGIDNALDNVNEAESELGAKEAAFVAKSEGLSSSREAALATRSRLQDSDFARESAIAVKSFILRSGTATLAKQREANASLALTLLPLVR